MQAISFLAEKRVKVYDWVTTKNLEYHQNGYISLFQYLLMDAQKFVDYYRPHYY